MAKLKSTEVAEALDRDVTKAETSDGEVSYELRTLIFERRDRLNDALERELGDDWMEDETHDTLFARTKVVLKEIPKPDEPKIKKRRSGRAMKLGEDGGLLGNKAVRPYG
ncbi:MAG: hypothetical protein ABIA92_04195 [Patescibacteria group bacterium]